MKKRLSTLLCALLLAALPFAAHALDVGVSWAVFATPDQPYLEINIEIAAASVSFKTIDSTHLQAGVETLILVKQGDKIVKIEKYMLQSPLVPRPQDLLDVKRFNLPEGEYTLEVTFKDQYDEANLDTYAAKVSVSATPQLRLSEVQLLRVFAPTIPTILSVKTAIFSNPCPSIFTTATAINWLFTPKSTTPTRPSAMPNTWPATSSSETGAAANGPWCRWAHSAKKAARLTHF